MNVVHLIGRIGQDPEVRYTKSGTAVVNLSLATNEFARGATGERETRTEWHRLLFWDKVADLVGKYVHKGDRIAVEGKLQTRKWNDRQGNKRETVEVNVFKMHFLNDQRNEAEPGADTGADTGSDEDIPF